MATKSNLLSRTQGVASPSVLAKKSATRLSASESARLEAEAAAIIAQVHRELDVEEKLIAEMKLQASL